MLKALIVDNNVSFIDDISRTLMIDERSDIEVYPETNIDNVDRKMDSVNPDVLVVSARICDSRDWNFGIPVRTYARNARELSIANTQKLECYGVVTRSTQLLNAIVKDSSLYDSSMETDTSVLTSNDLPTNFNHVPFANQQQTNNGFEEIKSEPQSQSVQQYEPSQSPYAETGNTIKKEAQPTYKQNYYQNEQSYQRGYQQDNSYQQTNQQYDQSYNQNYDQSYQQNTNQQTNQNYNTQQDQNTYQQTNQQETQSSYQQETAATPKQKNYAEKANYNIIDSGLGYHDSKGRWIPIYIYKYYDVESDSMKVINGYYDPDSGIFYEYPYPLLPPPSDDTPKSEPVQEASYDDKPRAKASYNDPEPTYEKEDSYVASSLRDKAAASNKQKKEEEEKQAGLLAEREFNVDMDKLGKRARCVTVYSAKGGVGKTTIACEIATFLALTAHHRGKYKVCIADFNIDFGDVMNTLNFDQRGAVMTTWAADIKARLERGEKPEDIQYSRDRIMVWLQHKEEDGLYALLAPTSNIDSMDIGEKEINIMLDNLISNCGFDFVICDTGNNTRDSSFIALEKADVVLMVLEQVVNTANCNNSFLQTAERVGFDTNKIKLIINRVRPKKSVGISPEELETAFVNQKTGRHYRFETLAKIKYSDDVTNSGNLGTPLVYDSTHEFTKSIGNVVRRLIGEETVLEEPKKRSVWDRIIGRK